MTIVLKPLLTRVHHEEELPENTDESISTVHGTAGGTAATLNSMLALRNSRYTPCAKSSLK